MTAIRGEIEEHGKQSAEQKKIPDALLRGIETKGKGTGAIDWRGILQKTNLICYNFAITEKKTPQKLQA